MRTHDASSKIIYINICFFIKTQYKVHKKARIKNLHTSKICKNKYIYKFKKT